MRRTSVFVAITITVAALIVAWSAAEAGTALYLQFDGIEGESKAIGHENWSVIDSVQWGVTATSSSPGSGQGSGKAVLQDLTWTQQMDKSIPPLFLDTAMGRHIPTATIDFVSNNADRPFTYFEMKFEEAFITSLSLSSGGDRPSIAGSFAYSTIEMKYYEQNATGGVQLAADAKYDLTALHAASVDELVGLYALGLSGPQVTPVPAPATLWLLGTGLAGLAGLRRKFTR